MLQRNLLHHGLHSRQVLLIELRIRIRLLLPVHHLAEQFDTGQRVLHRVQPEVDEYDRCTGRLELLDESVITTRAVTRETENGEVGFDAQRFLIADAVFRCLADQRNLLDAREFLGVGVEGLWIHGRQIALPADDTCQRLFAFQQCDRHQQAALAKQDAVRVRRDADRAAGEVCNRLRGGRPCCSGRRACSGGRRRSIHSSTGPEHGETERRAGRQDTRDRAEAASP